MLDRNSTPMRDFPTTLPATCSSTMEEWLLVAILHADTRIQIGDIHGRMSNEAVNLGTNTLSMRMTRFRLEAGLLPREQRGGSDGLKEGYKKVLGERCFTENSTHSFGRKLTRQEIAEVKQPNQGKFSQKSKNKARGLNPEGAVRRNGTNIDNAIGGGLAGLSTGIHEPESNPEFLKRMFPNLRPAAHRTIAYQEDIAADFGLPVGGDFGLVGGSFESNAEFVARMPSERVSTLETRVGDGVTNIQLGGCYAQPGLSQDGPSVPSLRSAEKYEEFIPRVFPTQIPTPETEVGSATRGHNAQPVVMSSYSKRDESNNAVFESATGAHGHYHSVQGVHQGFRSTRSALVSASSTPGQSFGAAVANGIRSQRQNQFPQNAHPDIFANTAPLTHKDQFTRDRNSSASKAGPPSHGRKRCYPSSSLDDPVTEASSKRQKRSALDTQPGTSTTRAPAKRQKRSARNSNTTATMTRTRFSHSFNSVRQIRTW